MVWFHSKNITNLPTKSDQKSKFFMALRMSTFPSAVFAVSVWTSPFSLIFMSTTSSPTPFCVLEFVLDLHLHDPHDEPSLLRMLLRIIHWGVCSVNKYWEFLKTSFPYSKLNHEHTYRWAYLSSCDFEFETCSGWRLLVVDFPMPNLGRPLFKPSNRRQALQTCFERHNCQQRFIKKQISKTTCLHAWDVATSGTLGGRRHLFLDVGLEFQIFPWKISKDIQLYV